MVGVAVIAHLKQIGIILQCEGILFATCNIVLGGDGEVGFGRFNSGCVTGEGLGDVEDALFLHQTTVHMPRLVLQLEYIPADGVDLIVKIRDRDGIALHGNVAVFFLFQLTEDVII